MAVARQKKGRQQGQDGRGEGGRAPEIDMGAALLGAQFHQVALDAPDQEWNSPLAAFEAAYAHEQYITGRINDLVALSIKENDYASHSFLQWFVNEQVEEEATVDGIVQNLKMMEGDKRGLFMIDRELGGRTEEAEEA